jgi:transcriptional regulator with GAF, ATPase, and Fis domain
MTPSEDRKIGDITGNEHQRNQRLEIMQRLSKKQVSQKEAGQILNLSIRQIKRLLKAYHLQRATGLVSKQRRRKSNNCLSADIKRRSWI